MRSSTIKHSKAHLLTFNLLVTPLDVVRVRLQSQSTPPQPSLSPSSFPTKLPSFVRLPPNIGVTQCCREVFWVNNSSPYCIANASPTATYTALNPAIPNTSTVAADCVRDDARQRTFNSTLDGLRKIARNEGPTSLWRGLSPTLVMAIPANVIYFTGYDALRWNPSSPFRNIPDAYAPLIAGSIARVAAAATISPIEMFRTRMQAATSRGTGVFKDTVVGMKQLVRTQGPTSLWRGLTLTMWRDVPFSGIYWWGYETVRGMLTDRRERRAEKYDFFIDDQDHSPAFVDSFIAGALSGAVASIVTTPFDVGKTRQQVLEKAIDSRSEGAISAATNTLKPGERSMPRFIHAIWKAEGLPGLFKGWAARTLKVAPACAIMISSYELGKKMAKRMNERKLAEADAG